MENKLQDLLSQVNNVVLADKIVREEKRKQGEYFNVFNILRLRSEELRLHSAFLAELLNPQGSHGMEDAFLIAFIKEVGIDDLNFDTKNAECSVEFYIGQVTETEGGRIDIIITNKDKNKAIIIENKIYARDQEKQLSRYKKYANNYKYYKLLYLTLEGEEASKCSIGKEIFEYQCISYYD